LPPPPALLAPLLSLEPELAEFPLGAEVLLLSFDPEVLESAGL
jgi:hypothetical protein